MSNARFSIIQAKAVRDPRVSDAQLRVLNALGMYSDRDGWCFPSQGTLAEDIGKSRQTVNGYIADLTELGYVEKHKRFDNSIRYRLLFDTPLVEPALQGLSNPPDTNVPTNVPINTNTSSVSSDALLPLEWQIAAEVKEIVLPDQKESQYMDAANIIAMGFGAVDYHLAYGIAYTFMKTRGIVIPQDKLKGQRKVVRSMMAMGVLPNHVQEATEKLMEAGMTITTLYSIEKTAVDLANPATPDNEYHGASEGV